MTYSDRMSLLLTWLARLSSVAVALFIGAFVVGEMVNGVGKPPSASEWLGLAFFPVGLLFGLAIGWWKELPGGLITMLSLAGFYIWNYSRSGSWPSGPWIPLLSAPGLVFIFAALTRKRAGEGSVPRPGHSNRRDGMSVC